MHRITLYNVPPQHVSEIEALGFALILRSDSSYTTVRKSANAIRYLIARCKELGIKGRAQAIKQVKRKPVTDQTPADLTNPRAIHQHGGFGGRLTAAPIKSRYRLRQRRR